MNLHKSIRLTPHDRTAIWHDHTKDGCTPTQLAQKYRVSRPTIYKVLQRARLHEFHPRLSKNSRFTCLECGLKRLAKIEQRIESRLKQRAKRYNKSYPGELVHFDTKMLPFLTGETRLTPREQLFVAIDDYSRELFAAILPDKSQMSSASFLRQVITECSYTIEYAYSDNGKEYKGTEHHAFVQTCMEHAIGQRFTRVKRPQTNGKAERVIRTLIEMWRNVTAFKSRAHRKKELLRFVNFYNTVKPHKGIDGLTPHEKLQSYFYPESVNNA